MADPNWNKGFYYDKVPPHSGMKLAREIATISYRSGPEWEQRFGRKRSQPLTTPSLWRTLLQYDPNSLLYVSKAMDMFDLSASISAETAIRRARNTLRLQEGKGSSAPENAATPPEEQQAAACSTGSAGAGTVAANPKANETDLDDPKAQLNDLKQGLSTIKDIPALVLGIQSDILFPVWQQKEVADCLRETGNKNVTYYELDSMYGHDAFLLEIVNVGSAVKGHLELRGTLITTLKECSEADIIVHVEATPDWIYPRGDLFHWVGVLNRFDDLLDNLCKTHDMKKAQPKPFSAQDKRLTLAILDFSRLLLENCTNRNLYASYEHLNDLLHARDLDVVESCLRLLLRPAQRHSAQRSARSIFSVSQDRLLALSHSWGSKVHGLDLLQLVDENATIPDKLSSLHFQFYRTMSQSKTAATTTAAVTEASSSTLSTSTASASASATTINTAVPKQRRSSASGSSSTTASSSTANASASEGVVAIYATDVHDYGSSDYEILAHFVKEYQIPEEHQFSLLNRIRVATAIKNAQDRRQLLTVRLLAIAVMAHVLPEAVVVDKFFVFEPEVIQSLTDLIHPDHKVPFDLQTVALFALDGVAHLRNKQADVLTAINASASHGVLMYMLRKVISGLDTENAPYSQDFLDAMFAFIAYVISSQSGGSMVISAGLVPVLLQLLTNKHASQLKNVTKGISILDSLIYGFGAAFTSFCTSDGLNLLVARMKEEVDCSLKLVEDFGSSAMSDTASTSSNKENEISPVPFEKTALLKAMFKFVHHMMQSPGTQEGLRNLIDTTLPATLKAIMENPSALGTAVYAHAINTMASFIHNEPTSLTILQDAKIPQTLLASLSNDIPASTDVMMSIPGAFGAVCLNPVGLEMFNKEFELKKFFDIFTSAPHVRAFQDNDVASNLGMSVDELVRHQPTLRGPVMVETLAMLKRVLALCSRENVSADDMVHCSLQRTRAADAPPLGEAVEEDQPKSTKKDSLVPQLIEGAARFCESFFQNAASAKDFISMNGIDTLMQFYSLPTLPYDLANTPSFFTLSHLIKLLSETSPGKAVTEVLEEVRRLLYIVHELLESESANSELVKYIDISASTEAEIADGNRILGALISLHALSGLLSDMFCAPAFSHGRNSASVLFAFINANGHKVLAGLGQLHRMCVWESIALRRQKQKEWSDPTPKTKKPLTYDTIPGTVDDITEEPEADDKASSTSESVIDMYSPTAINTKYFKFVLTQIPHYLTPLYQGIAKMLYNRGVMDSDQRVGAFKLAKILSTTLQQNILWERFTKIPVFNDKYTYLTTMLRLIPFMMLDDRNPRTLQTIAEVAFVRTDGLNFLFTTLDKIWVQLGTPDLTAADKAKVYGAMEIVYSVLQTVTSSKLLHDSSHTSAFVSKDDKNRGEDYFEPHEFLVHVRSAVALKVLEQWKRAELRDCPPSTVQQLIQIMMNILRAEGEQKPEAPAAASVVIGGAPHLFGSRPIVADAASVDILEVVATALYEQEREAAAARAGVSTVGSTSGTTATGQPSESSISGSSAAEPDSSTAGAGSSEAAAAGDDSEEYMLKKAMEMSKEGSSSETSKATVPTAESFKQQQEELAEARKEMKASLMSKSLELIADVDGIIFAVRDLLLFLHKDAAQNKGNESADVLERVVDSCVVACGTILDKGLVDGAKTIEKFFASHLRLLALLFGEVKIQSEMEGYVQKLLPKLMAILAFVVDKHVSQKENSWVSPLLLMIEGFISLSDEPKALPDDSVTDEKAKELQQDKEMQPAIVSESDMDILLKYCISLLKEDVLSKDVVLSVFRILVRLTRHHRLAVDFLQADGLPLMFATLKPDRLGVQGQQSFIIMIMRHIIEDTAVLQATMETEIIRWFSQPSRPRTGDIQAYLRHNNYLGLRDLDAFIAGTLKTCKVAKHDTAYRALYLVLAKNAPPLKPDDKKEGSDAKINDKDHENESTSKDKESVNKAEEIAAASTSTAAVTAAVSEASKKYSSEVSEAVMYYLVTELLNCRSTTPPADRASSGEGADTAAASTTKAATATVPAPTPATVSATTEASDKSTATTTAPETTMDPDFVHRCFLLQCLNELVVSYPSCKSDLMNYSRRKGRKDSLNTASKPRTNWLNYLLSDLIPYRGTVGQSNSIEIRKQSIESNFASGVLVAMCSNNDNEEEEKKPFNELVQVRRFVVDGITRTFKDTIASSEPIEVKYGKYWSLSELSYKILGASSAAGSLAKLNEDMSINIVKVMLEKNFISTLTNVLADVDLNYPHAKVLVNAVLKPLEHLTKLSLKMNRATEPGAARPRRRSTPMSGQGSGAGSGDDAPDLYRNSSLGMFDGVNIESEEDGESGDSISDEDMFEGEEFDEETASDASDLSEDDLGDSEDDEDVEAEDVVHNPFRDDHGASEEDEEDEEDHDEEDHLVDEDEDEEDDEDDDDDEIDAEIQEALDRDQEDDEDMVMEWGDRDGRGPVMLGEDEIGEVITDDDDDLDEDGHGDHDMFDDGHHNHHHHHHSDDEGTEDDHDDGEEDDEDASEDEDDEDMDGDEDGEGHDDMQEAGEFLQRRPQGRNAPWDMTSTFVINENALRSGRPLFEALGRRHRPAGQERGLIWDDIGADQGRFSYLQEDDLPALGNAAGRNPFLRVSDDVITHPLLAQPPAAPANAGSGDIQRARGGPRSIGITDWQSFEEMLQGNAQQVLGTLLNGGAVRAGQGGAFRIEVNNDHSTTLIPLDRPGHHHHHHHHPHHGLGGEAFTATISLGRGPGDAATVQRNDMFSIVHDFVPHSTSQRWSQECRMMYGATAQDKASRLQNHIITALIPAAKEEARLKFEREAKEMEQRRKADAERKKVAEEKRKADEEAERLKKEEEEKAKMAEEKAAAERVAVRQTEQPATADGSAQESADAASSSGSMIVEAPTGGAPEAAPAPAAPARRTVMIDGELVDITDSDIDAEFLEALPEEMRREVYNDYLQAHRPPAYSATSGSSNNTGAGSSSGVTGSGTVNSTNNGGSGSSSGGNSNNINPDFLNALPQEMRDELDELIRGPRPTVVAPPRGAPPGIADPLAAVSPLLSRLAPQLRQVMRDDPRGMGPLPPSFLADAQTLLNRLPTGFPGVRAARAARDRLEVSNASVSKKAAPPREGIQLMDKSSLAVLVRLMFLPQPLSKNILNKLLVNLCENSKTRSELFSLLLSILQDGGSDLATVDKSFAQMSLRGKPLFKAHQLPKGAKGPMPMQASVDNVPNLVARRCFESLFFIVSYNDQASLFFLSEHDNVTLKRPSKKGKGKEKAISSKYPIVLLLDLLERPIFVENSVLMEQLMSLLSTIFRPLAALMKTEEKKDTDDKDDKDDKAAGKEKEKESTAGDMSGAEAAAETPAASAPETKASEEGSSGEVAEASAAAQESKEPIAADAEQAAFKPPVIPDHCLQLVVRVLTAGECSSRTFQHTLSVIQNLSLLEGAREIITSELVSAARDLGVGILENLESLSHTLDNAMSGVDVQGMALEKFSPASSKQAKLLRVLKTIDYMYSRKQAPPTPATMQVNIELAPTLDPEEADAVLPRSMRDINSETLNLNKDEEKATEIYESLNFHALWTKIGSTLELIHERSDMIHVATVLLPLIESFMVVCKYVGLRPSTLEVEEEASKANSNSTEELFLQFTEKHSKILNIMVRNNPALMSGSFSLLVHNPKMLEFDNKRNYFTQQLHKRNNARDHHGSLQMNVRREMVFMDSYSHWQARSGDEIKYSKLNVKFHGEEGVDGGGVTREWFQVLARQMFNPDYALFKTSAADKLTYQPNRASWVNSDHLLFFRFIGRVIGKAIYDGRLLDAYFTRSFYKHILGRPVDYRDVEAVDPEYYKSLVWMLENDITDIVDETFSVETDDFGNMKTVDLKPNGRNIPVTEENKHEYVKYITEQKLTLAIKDQIHSFLKGFHEIIPAHLISIFNEQELELLISGLPDIDIDEWKNNAEYQNYTQASPQIQNFWRAVRSFDQTERAKLLQFVTGTSKVPLGGFSQLQGISGIQKFQIHKDFSSTKRLPSAHTCFNQLDLPEYETYEELRQQLLTAISECSTGFAFA
ncbi:hypothetical protein BGZ70_009313 [Mortierella alpina]|uniref:HECT-type E3 ubiquitin transferase n=1 Tax=Mortierella alpina TaxID=64518 RepID=A0A9P6J3R7_MORAP|nr:hypothetical protein BGZ70_009313 [Mortierella alpina]